MHAWLHNRRTDFAGIHLYGRTYIASITGTNYCPDYYPSP